MIIMFRHRYILKVPILSTHNLKISSPIWFIRSIRIISINSIHIYISQAGSQQNAEQRQVQTPTPQVNQPINQNTSQRPINPTYAEVSTAQQGGETAQTQTENQTQKNK